MSYKASIYKQNGTLVTVDCTDLENRGIHEVGINYTGDDSVCLDPDNGARISIPTDGWGDYMANWKYSEFWCAPAFGSDYTAVPRDTQLLLYRIGDHWGAIVPVVSQDYKCVLEGTPDGLTAHLFSWTEMPDCTALAFVTAEGDNPYKLVEDCVRQALQRLNTGVSLREERRYPAIFEYLGWCSWDAMPIGVHEAGILEKCEEFRTKQIPVKWVIFDDMWAEVRPFRAGMAREDFFKVHRSPLYDIEAGYDRFPHGLSFAIEGVKQYGMEVGIWLPTTGYWTGIEPGSPADTLLKPYTTTAIDGITIGDWHEEKSFGYYNTIHRFYKECGAVFMKVDNQTMIRRFYKGMASVGRIAREYHRGLEASMGLNFDHAMINCMGMGAEDMWNRAYSPISRCSDDFKPEDRAWFTKHILQCTYNSILQGVFYWNDYDMWWTDDSQAEKNSLLRAVSGGPIYVSDAIGRSRPEILAPLAFADGRILRCDRSGMPTPDCILTDPESSGRPLKIQNITGDCGVIAAFNITREDAPVCGTISLDDIPDLDGDTYVLYDYFAKTTWTLLQRGETYDFTLQNHDDYRLFHLIPYENDFAPIGLIDKFISPAAIIDRHGEEVTLYESGAYAYIKDGKLCIEQR